ncbi:hypothetical protein GS399_10590 [Pedobacter sp. HMF7647]|uniref:DUF6089 domain-containing protein n=1 Tax=Hufsiella arboris TaxID=2695275 RepID=A0A7K1YBL0_9SPHI|nr:DUF6089 family protein [Hufsiella arboris]MXV51418.1 hypothetical protein [Hufsiella arboris]
MRKILCLFLLITTIQFSRAQTWELGAFAGSSGYIGDLNQLKLFKFTDLGYGGLVKRNFDGYWSLKLNIYHGEIRGEDAKSDNEQERNRNLNFYSPVTEGSLQVEFNFFNYMTTEFNSKRFSPFLFVGFGGVLFDPRAEYNGIKYMLHDYGTEGQDLNNTYRQYTYSIPYGAGVKYNFSGNWSLIGELGYRTTGTDFLDDVSGYYPTPQQLNVPNDAAFTAQRQFLSDPSVNKIGVPGTQRGDLRKRDTYMFAGISLTYTFVSQKCATF